MANKKFFVTTPIYYVNDRPHLGHAYTTIAADVAARYHRFLGEKVFFLTGTDEHGAKIEKAAQKSGKAPKEFADENSEKFRQSWKKLNISYDGFIRTTDPKHKKAAQKALEVLYKNGFIKKGVYQGLYCFGCEQYKTKNDLIAGKCPDHKIAPELIEEESYIFKLSKFQDVLRKKIVKDELYIQPKERKNEVLAFLGQELRDISISRQKVKWGIPLPFDRRFTVYVWIEALFNYLTGIGWEGNPKELPDFWPPELQLMGKDILRVHATIWPALILALKIPLPKNFFVHGYFTTNGQKMSKSLGNIIWPEEIIEKFGVDAARYLLLSVLHFGQDGDISWQKLKEEYNADLAAGLGNLVSRVINMAVKVRIENKESKIENNEVKKNIKEAEKKWKEGLSQFKFSEALASIWDLIRFCDQYIEKESPWKESKNQISVINDLLIALASIAQFISPFLPETSRKIFNQLGLASLEKEIVFKIKKSEPLFPKVIS